jgi:phage tail sheath gpL-like
MVTFNQIPNTLRTPLVFVEFDKSKAQQGPTVQPYQLLVLGQKTSAGTVAELTPKTVTSADQGAGALFLNNKATKVTVVAIDDAAGGVKATGTLTFTGPSTAAGTLYLYLAGYRLTVAVASGASASTIATNVAAAINAATRLPLTASANAAVVTVTARNAGTLGNYLDLRANHYSDELLPAGVGLSVAAMSGGSGDPDVTEFWPLLGDEHYNIWAFPWLDTANLNAAQVELADRAGPLRMIEGWAFGAKPDSHANLITFGDGRNDPYVSINGFESSPTPQYERAAAIAGAVAYYGNIDPARPFQTLPLHGVIAPRAEDRFTREERNLLLWDGIATTYVDAGGVVRIERLVTTYQENEYGSPDTSLLDVNSGLTLGYLRYDFRASFTNAYPRHKLADDGTRFGAGQAVLTPKIAKAWCIAKFRQWEQIGLVENFAQFKQDLVVERDAGDPNRLNFLLPPDLINQLRVAAVQIGFRL